MSRYKQLGPRDEAVAVDGDGAFIGVDMRTDPTLLQPGTCAEAINKEFRQGKADTRHAFKTMRWAHQVGNSFPWDFPITFDEPVGFGAVYGACVFSDPFGNEWMIIATGPYAFQVAPNTYPHVIHYPPGVVLTKPVTFTQAFNVLIMWRGEDADPIKLEVTQQFQTNMVFEPVPDETQGNYTATIPDAERGLNYGNRVWVMYKRSRVAFSDILTYTRYDPAFSTIWVNEGGSDAGKLLFPVGGNSIVAFKDQSIYAMENVLPAPALTSTVRMLTNQHGLKAAESASQIGSDVLFLADDGIYAISQVLDNALQAGTDPISAPMQPLFNRVMWEFADKAQGIYHDRKYLLALPIDGAEYNNAIAVFDFLNNAWSGWWEFGWLDALKFLRVTVNGRKRLVIVSGNSLGDSNNGVVYMLGDGYMDERFGEEADILDTVLSRGYTCGSTETKAFCSMEAEIATWHGAGTVEAIRDGVNEESSILQYNKDRTKYTIFGRDPYDITNAGQNHSDPYREDYSVIEPEGGIAIETEGGEPLELEGGGILTIEGGGVDFSGSENTISFPVSFPLMWDIAWGGIALGLHQNSSERAVIRQKGRHLQVRVSGTRGRTSVMAVSVHARLNAMSRRTMLV